MKRTTTIITCDLCGQVYDDIPDEHNWSLVNKASCSSYLDLCSSCYVGLVRYISSRRPKKTNKDQMTFDKDFPEFVTEEKSGNYFEKLVEADPEPWKENN